MSFNSKTGLWEGYVYIIKNDINEKVYVGQTLLTVYKRFMIHMRSHRKTDKSKVQPFDLIAGEMGVKHFYYDILLKLTNKNKTLLREELKEKEIEFISQYKSNDASYGYNISAGGDNYDEKGFPIWQYTKEGEFIREWKSISEASRCLGISKSDIARCCKKERGVCIGNYLWSYKNELYRTDIHPVNRKVKKYSLDGTLIEVFLCINEVTDDKKLRHRINNCCNGYLYNVDGFVYRYVNDSFDKYSSIPQKKGGHTKQKCSVVQMDLKNNIINVFPTIKEASIASGVNVTSITNCCKKRQETVKGFRFAYKEEVLINDET